MKPLHTTIQPLLLTLTLLSTITPPFTTSQKFDPYALNGGLIAAVAGRDYVLIASDTRLTDGVYGVQSRRYLSGRLWSASSSTTTTTLADDGVVMADVVDDSLVSSSSSSSDVVSNGGDTKIITSSNANKHELVQQSPLTITSSSNVHWDSDGSLLLPSITTDIASSSSQLLEPTNNYNNHPPITTMTTNPPIIIGSAGCASDCESLKRRMRLELDALHMNNGHGNTNQQLLLGVDSVANLLQQILYSRRGFPFYSFCVVAGLHPPEEYDDDELLLSNDGSANGYNSGREGGMEGAVYVYDAIGSYERVAVGSAGTGRELLQPILDQLFSDNDGGTTRDSARDQSIAIHNDENHSNNGKSGDILAIPPMKQRVGVAGSLRPPVRTTVRCSLEDAVRNVARAYQSVAEREISVGDEVVICVVKSGKVASSSSSSLGDGGTRTEGAVLKVYRYPLK
eukprot:CAMPEP_0201690472 /NCGR_PEP_ID=MMETSP0578-20130828/3917_1 /ASSEMBLY_ACC=CAM_ASM_000663 /TAXON_ID=267565 /ORGANISM="Skeletonema grethea, Strain CCMP 1804" /LENGTH=453 /DNA_ID=CAMNT_0048175481 /DNA_START=35 /DNA_END=1393 /DNA_ORIENTATION=+